MTQTSQLRISEPVIDKIPISRRSLSWEMNQVKMFVALNCERDNSIGYPVTQLYRDFLTFVRAVNCRPVGPQVFIRLMVVLGFRREYMGRRHHWMGIRSASEQAFTTGPVLINAGSKNWLRETATAQKPLVAQVVSFIDQRCEIHALYRTPVLELYSAFSTSDQAVAVGSCSRADFARALRELGFENRKSSSIYWMGLRLRPRGLSAAHVAQSVDQSRSHSDS